ncbi:MAG: GNAT family N-acetyltransferase [Candidatus Pseudobacter hemicellulosilyticus]|uniref:GNAT family N-acetyltransferase n=1 Tax=Candidatus Pseudobacter hemicellulosilyticus TaxID=3121375 RepID=A0AAJ6BGH0_9BACT|nr:MAG: GNAT family N-acetyltransferase [Pseudobacter sp.]
MIETTRLLIIPLTVPSLELYLLGEDRFEEAHQLARNNRTVSREVFRMVQAITLPNMRREPDDGYLFHTFWLVIERSSKTVVAELGFKGTPNARGEVEIGYGTMPARQREGFMTEAVGALVVWARKRNEIASIVAETDQGNNASQKVLHRNGFTQYNKKENMLWWRFNLK